MVTKEELNEIFERIGNDFGYRDVTAEYAPFRDMKIKWSRTYDWARFTVSDYLEEAPAEVIEDIVATLMNRMRGMDMKGYLPETEEWLTSDEFLYLNRDRYIERSRSIDPETENSVRLWESYRRLVDAGLVSGVRDLKMYWSKGDGVDRSGQSSCLMRTVIMNRRLMDPKVPTEVLDYCLLRQIANIAVPFGIMGPERRKEVIDLSDAYPGADTARRWLDQVMMEV